MKTSLWVATLVALAACGGGGSVTPSAPQSNPGSPNTKMQSVSISLIVPVNTGTSGTHRPAYISASALGAGIVATQGATTVNATVDLSSGSSACTGSGSSRTCTTSVTVPTGSDVFTVTIYNQAPVNNTIPAGAAILGIGTSTVNVIAGSTTSVSVFVGGEIAHFGATIPSGSLPANGQPQSAVLVIAPTDFGDNPITAGTNDPYANPITVTVTESGGSGYASLSLNGGAASSSVQVTESSDSVTLNYSGAGPPGYSFTVGLSASGVSTQSSTIAPLIASVNGTAVTSVSLNGSAVGALQLGLGEAGSSRTYTASLTTCTNIATIGAVSGSGASATLPVTGGSTASASGCTLTITDSGNVALALPVTNTPVSGGVGVNGTSITEMTGFTNPYGITSGPDGNIYVTDSGSVFAIQPGNPVPTQYVVSGGLFDITTGSDGALWVTNQAPGGVARVTTTGIIAQYAFGDTPQGIAADPLDGTLLVADPSASSVWQVTVGGTATLLPMAPSGPPSEIVFVPGGSNGFAWFTETGSIGEYNIGSATLTHQVTVPGGNTAKYIAYGADGNVWFTASGGATPFIGWINPSNPTVVNQIALGATAQPRGITAGADNAMWFVDAGTNSIGEVSLTSHTVTLFAIPTAAAGPQEITTGADGRLWFTENAVGKIGEVVP
jgi:virginiamycin B lyase